MNHRKTLEPMWWGLFSAGGVVAAFLIPIHIVLLGLAIPLGWLPGSAEIFQSWIVRLYLFVLISLPLYHWAHRFSFTMSDLGLRPIRKPLAILCYGSAIAGTVVTAWVLLRI
ncbi:MAG: fumarate reductase subunit D [SAR324 cluster bacterium]|nr:fumarate reductase subunit D [SAR324 cluster bacterium]MCZ6552427.1 fumarate reductase subunit D [SAR324 cluster bacterium]MCZ6748083.1 fumarate reductase subunit D [SAR324 cluster bacterium]